MIKTNELRVGNLVYIINRNSEVHLPNEIPFKVLTIGLDVECLMYKIKPVTVEKWNKYYYKDLSPIPLTGELLINFGFQKDRNGYFLGILSFSITSQNEFMICINDRPIQIICKYVHQLQNLYFSLTGSELQLVNIEN